MILTNYKFIRRIAPLVLLFVAPAAIHAQPNSVSNVQQQFDSHNRVYAEERVYMHTDKDFYVAGEIVWFKLYALNGETHQPMQLSKVAYVEILNRQNKPVAQAKISLAENGGSGSFYLPLTIPSDQYTVRAYTNWMKNFSASVFYEKPITIVNTVKAPVVNTTADSSAAIIGFFPEGGQLVEGMDTKIGFHITDNWGKGIDANGIVVSDKGDTVVHFSTARFGMGRFNFKPLAGYTYTAIITLPGDNRITRPLPAITSSGYVLNVTDNNDGRWLVKIQARGTQGQRGEDMVLLVHTQQSVKVVKEDYVNYNSQYLFLVNKERLGEGITYFTLFNKDQQPVCERLIFTQPKLQTTATIASDKNKYATRQPVNLSVGIAGKDNTPVPADLSVSVFQSDSFQPGEQNTIVSYLWLNNDLHGQIESPGFYFTNDPAVEETTDNLMLTSGWRRFKWDNILTTTSSKSVKYLPEFKGHYITAKVTNVSDGMPASNITSYLSVPSTPPGLYTGLSNDSGFVRFEVADYYGQGEVNIQARDENGKTYKVDIQTPFSEQAATTRLPLFSIGKENEEKLVERSIAMQAQNIYIVDSIRRFIAPLLTDTLPFYGRPEFTYRLDDYKRFTTMEEVLREYVSPITLVPRNGHLNMRIIDELYHLIYDDYLLVMLDGVPLTDYNKILTYDPLKVKKLDVVPRTYIYGPSIFSGIASFETYQGRFDAYDLNPAVVSVDYEGLQLNREFYSPDHSKDSQRDKRIPDLRTTLHWIPHVIMNENEKAEVSFFTSDRKGKFIVVVEGISEKGEPLFGTTSFTVE